MSNVVTKAVPSTRKAYVNSQGFNGSNEGTPEQLEQINGYVLEDTNGRKHWISEVLYNELVQLIK